MFDFLFKNSFLVFKNLKIKNLFVMTGLQNCFHFCCFQKQKTRTAKCSFAFHFSIFKNQKHGKNGQFSLMAKA